MKSVCSKDGLPNQWEHIITVVNIKRYQMVNLCDNNTTPDMSAVYPLSSHTESLWPQPTFSAYLLPANSQTIIER